MIKKGDIYGVNGKVLHHHFLVYLGNELFYDTIDGKVYLIPLEQAEAATMMKTHCDWYVLELIENLPKDVFETVVANTQMLCRYAKPLTLVTINNG